MEAGAEEYYGRRTRNKHHSDVPERRHAMRLLWVHAHAVYLNHLSSNRIPGTTCAASPCSIIPATG